MMLKSYLTASITKEGIIHDFLLHFTALIQKAKKDQCPVPPALYLVGGYVRDLILNFYGFSAKPSDIDLVVAGFSADEIEILMGILEKCSERCPIKNIYRVENSFPVIKVHVEGLNSPIDVALARGYETSTGPGHQDFVFKTKDITIKEDLARRDFTINAMALQIISRGDSIETTIIDEFSGLADICDRRISTVGPPGRTFREDPIRQIRAIRFVARLKDFGFQIEPKTLDAIKTTFPSTFHTIPMEPLIKEVGKAFKENFPLAFALFRETGVLSHSFPFLDKMHQEDIGFLETIFSGLKGKLNVRRVWVLILFMMAREEIERIFKQEPLSLTERNYQIPATVRLSHELRLPSEITEHVGKLAQLYYHPYLPHPLSSLERALQWLKQRPGRGWLWKVYSRLTELETGKIPRLRSKIRLINTSVELYTKAELKGFFKGNGIEPGPIRAEMLFGAREKVLNGTLSSKEEFFREALSYYRKHEILIEGHIKELKRVLKNQSVTEPLISKVADRFQKEIRDILFDNPVRLIQRYMKEGVLKLVFPELEALMDLPTTHHHFFEDYISHSLETTSVLYEKFGEVSKALILAGIFHDIGKIQSCQVLEGKVTFYGSGRLGAEKLQVIGARLGIESLIIEEATFLVRARRYYIQPLEAFENWLKKRCLRIPEGYLHDLLKLWYADRVAMVTKKFVGREKLADLHKYNRVREKLSVWIENNRRKVLQTRLSRYFLVSGDDLKKKLHFQEGVEIGRTLRLIDRWEAEGLVSSKQEAFEKIREHLFRELISGLHEKIEECQSRSITQAENAGEYTVKTLQLLMIDPVSLLKRLEKMGILKYVFPEIEHLKGVVQSPRQHMEGDVYAHTLLALQKLKEHYPDASRIEILGVLLHDTGKPATRSVDEQGRITFYRHEEVGAEIAMDFCSRFSLDEGTAKGVTFLVKNHLHLFLNFPHMTDRAIRRWMKEEFFSSLLIVRHADLMGQMKPHGSIDLSTYQACLVRLSKIKPEEDISSADGLKSLSIDGKVIMEHFGITPGRKVGSLLKEAEEMLRKNPDLTKEDILRNLGIAMPE